ncbi:EVI2A protein, partial [Bucco capensis]|nr:EVI2A protein [Bucco capensis]
MKTKRQSTLHLTFPGMIIFALWLQTSANHTDYPRVIRETWSPSSQNQGENQNITEANPNSPLSISFRSTVTPFDRQASSLRPASPPMAQSSTALPATSAAPATAGPSNSSKPKGTAPKATCEDNKSLILICFVIIAVLVLICTFLFLSTVVLANKMSYLKKAQPGTRRPRSNGDILATSSFWPTAAGTWHRMPKEPTATDLIMQDLISGRDAVIQRKTEDETMKKLTMETDHEQENKEPILTNFVVEI